MRTAPTVLLTLLMVVTLPALLPAEEVAVDPAGFWSGAIETPNGPLAIHIALVEEVDSGWSATIDIPAQGLREFALSNVQVEGGRMEAEMNGIPGQPRFIGEVEDADTIAGSFEQGPYSMPFTLGRVDALPERPEGPSLPQTPVPGEGPAGDWLGVLESGPLTLRLLVSVSATAEGELTAHVDSVDQGAQPPVDSVRFEDGRLDLSMPAIQATFSGAINADGSAIDGTWSQGREVPLTLHRLDDPSQ